MSVVVFADSTCELTPSQATMLGVHLVPITITFGDRVYREGKDLSLRDFYDKVAASPEKPVTAPPTADAFAEAFGPTIAAGREIVCITVSSKLSKTYGNAVEAAGRAGGKVHVVDGKSLSWGTGLLVEAAARLAKSGADARTIVSALERCIGGQRAYACYAPQDLVATGRISNSQVLLGTTLKLVPVLRVSAEGALESECTATTIEKARDLLPELLLRRMTDRAAARIIVVHANVPEAAARVRDEIAAKLHAQPRELAIHDAGPTIVINTGHGTVAVFSMEEK